MQTLILLKNANRSLPLPPNAGGLSSGEETSQLKQETWVQKLGQKTEKNKLTQDDGTSTRKEKSSNDRPGGRNTPRGPTAANQGSRFLGGLIVNVFQLMPDLSYYSRFHALYFNVYVSFGNVCCRISMCPLSSSLTWCAATSGNSLWPLSSSFSEGWADASSPDGSPTGTFNFQFKLAPPLSYYGVIGGRMFSQSMVDSKP